jgi:hypothetical protein
MRLNRNRLRNMILREMRSMNEQTYNPTVTVKINFSDFAFIVTGEGTQNPDYDAFSTIDEVIAFIEQNSGANIMYNIFPDMENMRPRPVIGGTGDQAFAIKELESAKSRYGRMFSGR